MLLYKHIYKNEVIYTINTHSFEDFLVESILSSEKNSSKKIGINMAHVRTINSKKFILNLLNNKFKLYNIQNEVLTYLAIVLKDGFLKSYMSLEDLQLNKRELVRRHFLVA